MTEVQYEKIYRGLHAFETGDYNGATSKFWDAVKELWGIDVYTRTPAGYVSISDEKKFTFFVLKYGHHEKN